MKICLINSLYAPYYRGGAEVVVENTAQELINQNHQVVVISVGRTNGISVEGNLTIYRIKPWNVFSFLDINQRPVWLRLLWHPLDVFNVSSYFKVKNILAVQKPDLVITHNLKGIGYLIPRLIKKIGLRHWHTVHDVQLARPSGLILFGQEKPFLIVDKIYEKICRRLFGSPEMVISPSRWLLDYYRARGFFSKSQTLVLLNPVVFKKVDKMPDNKERKDFVQLLYVGQLVGHKGIIFLINTCKKLMAANWRLQIVGSGEAKEAVEQAIEGDLRFELVGRVEQQRVIEYYRQADLTIVPSFCYENSPAAISESLVANVPVIASDIGGIPELVKDDFNGFTFAPGNEKNLLEVLHHFLNHPENIEALKKNCFVSVRNNSVANYVKQLLLMY